MSSVETKFLEEFWGGLAGDPSKLFQVEFTGTHAGLPSRYCVGEFASAAVAAATLAVSELADAKQCGKLASVVRVDRLHACASYVCDRIAKPHGWQFDEDGDDVSGNFRTSDGWLRIHAMYDHHRRAALSVLDCAPNRAAVEEAILTWKKLALESAIVEMGGCAAELRSPAEWFNHPQGSAVEAEPLFSFHGQVAGRTRFFDERPDAPLPLAGLRVLDLTRVLAGPIGARFLAAYGADVIRVDPADFHESNALLIETTRGKRTLGLDLKSKDGFQTFEKLISEAEVLIHGYRPGAMERLGFSAERIAAMNPGICIVRLCAYGWTGPWSERRGFDSLVQMSSGIAFQAEADYKPNPLPAQALDYTTGYLIAAAACRGLMAKHQETRLSLARTAFSLTSRGQAGDPTMIPFPSLEPYMHKESSEWGCVSQLRCPGSIGDIEPKWMIPAGRIGKDRKVSWTSKN